MATIGVVSPPSRHGIFRSSEIVAAVLTNAGHDIRRHDMSRLPPENARFDLVIFYEWIGKHWLDLAPHTALIPNPEWFLDSNLEMLDQIDVVYAKSHDAVSIFEELGCTVTYTGFTSRDQWLPDVKRDWQRWLHVAGKSEQKGTSTILDVWGANPDFPHLTVVRNSPRAPDRRMPPNVGIFAEYLPDAVLQVLQNTAGVHLCPSEAEGWGHHIVEGLSVGAVVLTTDAPPMNEIVAPNCGILCSFGASKPQRLGTNYFVTPEALEASVRSTLDRDATELVELGRRAREFYVRNHHEFVGRLTAAVDGLLASD